jgi:hypothetical protein
MSLLKERILPRLMALHFLVRNRIRCMLATILFRFSYLLYSVRNHIFLPVALYGCVLDLDVSEKAGEDYTQA